MLEAYKKTQQITSCMPKTAVSPYFKKWTEFYNNKYTDWYGTEFYLQIFNHFFVVFLLNFYYCNICHFGFAKPNG